MKQLLVIATALTLCVALGASLAVANTKKVDTKVSINFAGGNSTDPYAPQSEDVFTGGLRSKKGCEKNRKVAIEGPTTGSDETSNNGDYMISVGTAPTGIYTAVAKRKVIKKQHRKIVCKKGTSSPITVE